MSVQSLTPGNSVTVAGMFRAEVRAAVGTGNRVQFIQANQGQEQILADVADSKRRIVDAQMNASGAVRLVAVSGGASAGSARVFDGADRRTFPSPNTGASVLS